MNPDTELKIGLAILESIMSKNGFVFSYTSAGRSSGGDFSAGRYENGFRYLNLSVRYTLGLVTYQLGEKEIDHQSYLRTVGKKGKYPGFSKQVSEAFEHLASDLENYFSVFLQGSEADLIQIMEQNRSNPRNVGFSALQ